jgi:hypothetical protein
VLRILVKCRHARQQEQRPQQPAADTPAPASSWSAAAVHA